MQAAETLVEGIDNAGVPDTEEGEEAAESRVRLGRLRPERPRGGAKTSLDDEADSLEESLEQFARGGARDRRRSLAGGAETIAEVAQADPELARMVLDTSECQQLRAEQTQ